MVISSYILFSTSSYLGFLTCTHETFCTVSQIPVILLFFLLFQFSLQFIWDSLYCYKVKFTIFSSALFNLQLFLYSKIFVSVSRCSTWFIFMFCFSLIILMFAFKLLHIFSVCIAAVFLSLSANFVVPVSFLSLSVDLIFIWSRIPCAVLCLTTCFLLVEHFVVFLERMVDLVLVNLGYWLISFISQTDECVYTCLLKCPERISGRPCSSEYHLCSVSLFTVANRHLNLPQSSVSCGCFVANTFSFFRS